MKGLGFELALGTALGFGFRLRSGFKDCSQVAPPLSHITDVQHFRTLTIYDLERETPTTYFASYSNIFHERSNRP